MVLSRAAVSCGSSTGLVKMVYRNGSRNGYIGSDETCYKTSFQNDLGISEGDLRYLRDNGLIDRCIVYDDTDWRLDDDGNWPEVL